MKLNFFDEVLKAGKLMLVALFAMGLTTACSSDDDDDNGGSSFGTPEYEAVAAKYVVEDSSSPYQSIELTASGNYLICRNVGSYAKPAAIKASASRKDIAQSVVKGGIFGHGAAALTRSYSEILYGTYTETADGTFLLDGFGTLTVTQDETGNAYSLVITPEGGTPKEYKASKQNANLNGEMSNKLCRTWKIAGYRVYGKVNGQTLLDESAKTLTELYTKLCAITGEDPSDIGDYTEDEPDQFVFTKTGTYVVYYKDSELAVSTWRWEDESNGVLRYSWDPDNFYAYDASGEVKIEFKGSQLYITEENVEDGVTIGLVYISNEVK